ncbi:MAG: hypothetical protein U1E91_02740 [Moraxella sp.]
MVNASSEQLPMSLLGASSVVWWFCFIYSLPLANGASMTLTKGWLALLMLVPG